VIKLQEKIVIDRPIEDVFNFVANGENLSTWNSAVFKVEKISAGPVTVGTQFWMMRNLPLGWAENTFEVIAYEPYTKFSIKVISGPTPFVYHYHLTPVDDSTFLTLDAQVQVTGLGQIAKPVLAIGIKKGIKDNLRTLKRLLETKESQPVYNLSSNKGV
jgi:ligand-binding SRPBCC domain-containing protein